MSAAVHGNFADSVADGAFEMRYLLEVNIAGRLAKDWIKGIYVGEVTVKIAGILTNCRRQCNRKHGLF